LNWGDPAAPVSSRRSRKEKAMASSGNPSRTPVPEPRPEKKPTRFVIKVGGIIPT